MTIGIYTLEWRHTSFWRLLSEKYCWVIRGSADRQQRQPTTLFSTTAPRPSTPSTPSIRLCASMEHHVWPKPASSPLVISSHIMCVLSGGRIHVPSTLLHISPVFVPPKVVPLPYSLPPAVLTWLGCHLQAFARSLSPSVRLSDCTVTVVSSTQREEWGKKLSFL